MKLIAAVVGVLCLAGCAGMGNKSPEMVCAEHGKNAVWVVNDKTGVAMFKTCVDGTENISQAQFQELHKDDPVLGQIGDTHPLLWVYDRNGFPLAVEDTATGEIHLRQ